MGEMTVRQAIEEQLVRYNECGREYLKQKREELKLKEEIDKTKIQMMNEMDWEALKIKLKYKKEEYIKEKMEETMNLLKEIREKKEDAELGQKVASKWYGYFMIVFEQEGDVEVTNLEKEDSTEE